LDARLSPECAGTKFVTSLGASGEANPMTQALLALLRAMVGRYDEGLAQTPASGHCGCHGVAHADVPIGSN